MLYILYNAFTFIELIVYVKYSYFCAIAFHLSVVYNFFDKNMVNILFGGKGKGLLLVETGIAH
jgi:hypothetical protein